MFNRNPRPTPPPQAPARPQQAPGPYSRVPQDTNDRYGDRHPVNDRRYYDGASEKQDHARRQSGQGGHTWQLRPTKSPNPQFTYGNSVAVSPFDNFPVPRGSSEFYVILNDLFVCTARQLDGFPQGQISLSDFQRSWASISLQDIVYVKLYDPFQEGGHRYLGSLDAELGFAGKKETEMPLDQDELQQIFTKVFTSDVSCVPLLTSLRIMRTKFSLRVKKSSWIIRAHRSYSSSKPSNLSTCLWTRRQLDLSPVCLTHGIAEFSPDRVR